MLILGGKEIEAKSVGVRSRKEGDIGTKTIQEFIDVIQNEVKNYI